MMYSSMNYFIFHLRYKMFKLKSSRCIIWIHYYLNFTYRTLLLLDYYSAERKKITECFHFISSYWRVHMGIWICFKICRKLKMYFQQISYPNSQRTHTSCWNTKNLKKSKKMYTRRYGEKKGKKPTMHVYSQK